MYRNVRCFLFSFLFECVGQSLLLYFRLFFLKFPCEVFIFARSINPPPSPIHNMTRLQTGRPHFPGSSASCRPLSTTVYKNELWATVLLLFAAPRGTLHHGYNHTVVCGLRSGHACHLTWQTTCALASFIVMTCERLPTKWILTTDNPTDPLNRPQIFFPKFPQEGLPGFK